MLLSLLLFLAGILAGQSVFASDIGRNSPTTVDTEIEGLIEKTVYQAAGPISLDSWKAVEDSVAKILTKYGVPGAQYAVFRNDSVLFYRNYGLAKKNPKIEVSDSSVFRLGSNSKHFTGVLALVLQEEGLLDLNQPLAEALPEFSFYNRWEATDPVRLVHLMEHTAGFDDIHFHEYAVNDSTISLAGSIQTARYQRESRWKPGTVSSYCNLGPALLARVIELKTGRNFEELVQEKIFNPAGIAGMSFTLNDKNRNRISDAHTGLNGNATNYWHIAMRPSGAINGTTHEMITWGQLLLNDGLRNGMRVLPKNILDRLTTPVSSAAAKSGSPYGYAMGFNRYVFKGNPYLTHSGATNGHTSFFWLYPSERIGCVVQVNSDQGEATSRISAVLRTFVLQQVSEPEYKPLSEANKELFEGNYFSVRQRNSFTEGVLRLFGRVRIVTENDTTRVKPLLGNTDEILVEWNGQVLLRSGNRAAEVITRIQDGNATLIDPLKLQKTSAIRFWSGFVLLVISAVVVLVSLFLALFWTVSLALSFLPIKHHRIRTGYAWWPLLAVFPLLYLFVLLSVNDSLEHIISTVEFGFSTLLIFVLSAFVPAFAAASLFNAWTRHSKGGFKTSWWVWLNALVTTAIAFFYIHGGYWAFRPWLNM